MPVTHPLVRAATVADAAAIARIHVASWRAAYRDIVPPEFLAAWTVEERERRWRDGLTRDASGTLVGTQENEVVGWVSFGPCRDDDLAEERAGEIQGLYVDPATFRGGVGRRLVAAAEDALRAGGANLVALWTLELNRAGRSFYERLAYEHDGATKPWAMGGGFTLTAVRYRRRLAPQTGPARLG